MRNKFKVVGLLTVVFLGFSQLVYAHLGSENTRVEIEEIEPFIEGVEIESIPDDTQLSLTNRSDKTLTVLEAGGRSFAKLDPDGSVYVNKLSKIAENEGLIAASDRSSLKARVNKALSNLLGESAYAHGDEDHSSEGSSESGSGSDGSKQKGSQSQSSSESTEPEAVWQRVAEDGQLTWHDPRLVVSSDSLSPKITESKQEVEIKPVEIPVMVDRVQHEITGSVIWVPSENDSQPAWIPYFVGTVILLLILTAVVVAKRRRGYKG